VQPVQLSLTPEAGPLPAPPRAGSLPASLVEVVIEMLGRLIAKASDQSTADGSDE
jgi:hypothetical protein